MCVVGTGASAVQFVPQIAPVVEHLSLHQRTPPLDRPPARPARLGPAPRALPQGARALQRLSRLRIYVIFESLLSVFVGRGERPQGGGPEEGPRPPAPAGARRGAARRLTPHYEPGCKRLLLSDDYYPSLTRPNVEVVDAPVASFTAHEVVGEDGIARPVDVVIMGTGFEAAEPPYAEHIVGRGRCPALRASGRRTAPRPTPARRWRASRTSSS